MAFKIALFNGALAEQKWMKNLHRLHRRRECKVKR